ncbi:MAG: class I SAM-dependent methyltransferase [Candidatus Thorarchaeota archaeon]
MSDYYSKKLSSNLLKRCYDIAPERVQQYLESEVSFVIEHINKSDSVLELGCGYGRVLRKLLSCASNIVGIDISQESLGLAKEYTRKDLRCDLVQGSAEKLPFSENSIDKVVCIQNGISAFKVDPKELIQESIHVTKPGGMCLFSSYSPNFWDHRLEWFKMQAEEGLLGEIDWNQTKEGVICCKDGFKATTFAESDFIDIISQLNLDAYVVEIDSSSVFCVINCN